MACTPLTTGGHQLRRSHCSRRLGRATRAPHGVRCGAAHAAAGAGGGADTALPILQERGVLFTPGGWFSCFCAPSPLCPCGAAWCTTTRRAPCTTGAPCTAPSRRPPPPPSLRLRLLPRRVRSGARLGRAGGGGAQAGRGWPPASPGADGGLGWQGGPIHAAGGTPNNKNGLHQAAPSTAPPLPPIPQRGARAT